MKFKWVCRCTFSNAVTYVGRDGKIFSHMQIHLMRHFAYVAAESEGKCVTFSDRFPLHCLSLDLEPIKWAGWFCERVRSKFVDWTLKVTGSLLIGYRK